MLSQGFSQGLRESHCHEQNRDTGNGGNAGGKLGGALAFATPPMRFALDMSFALKR
jgi:hypothetical protein